MMEMVFLGTGSAYPMDSRGASCIMLEHCKLRYYVRFLLSLSVIAGPYVGGEYLLPPRAKWRR